MKLNLAHATSIANASIVKAAELGTSISVAVCNTEGRIIVFFKMDGTGAMSGHEAMRRAIGAADSGEPNASHDAANEARRSSRTSTVENEGIGCSHQPGGLALTLAGEDFGAMGVCGAVDADQDVKCAHAGTLAFRELFRSVPDTPVAVA